MVPSNDDLTSMMRTWKMLTTELIEAQRLAEDENSRISHAWHAAQ